MTKLLVLSNKYFSVPIWPSNSEAASEMRRPNVKSLCLLTILTLFSGVYRFVVLKNVVEFLASLAFVVLVVLVVNIKILIDRSVNPFLITAELESNKVNLDTKKVDSLLLN